MLGECVAQLDTIYYFDRKQACIVKEIDTNQVKYSFPGEQLRYVVSKQHIQKIKFASGREDVLVDHSIFNQIRGIDDYEKVKITLLQQDVRGLFKIGEESIKISAAPPKELKLKEKNITRLKRIAAMQGGCMVHAMNEQAEMGDYSNPYQSASTPITRTKGLIYTHKLLDLNEFRRILSKKRKFMTLEESSLLPGSKKFEKELMVKEFILHEVKLQDNVITISGRLGDRPNETFKVVAFGEYYFCLYYERGNTHYYIKVPI